MSTSRIKSRKQERTRRNREKGKKWKPTLPNGNPDKYSKHIKYTLEADQSKSLMIWGRKSTRKQDWILQARALVQRAKQRGRKILCWDGECTSGKITSEKFFKYIEKAGKKGANVLIAGLTRAGRHPDFDATCGLDLRMTDEQLKEVYNHLKKCNVILETENHPNSTCNQDEALLKKLKREAPKSGRPRKKNRYGNEKRILAERMLRLGMSYMQVADSLGVSRKTIYNWFDTKLFRPCSN